MDLLRREQPPSFVTLHHEVIASQVRRVFRLSASCPYLLCRDLGARTRLSKTIDFAPRKGWRVAIPAKRLFSNSSWITGYSETARFRSLRVAFFDA